MNRKISRILALFAVFAMEFTMAGHGYAMFDGCKLLLDRVKLDNQVLIDYITESLGGVIGEEYEELTGQDRIVITE